MLFCALLSDDSMVSRVEIFLRTCSSEAQKQVCCGQCVCVCVEGRGGAWNALTHVQTRTETIHNGSVNLALRLLRRDWRTLLGSRRRRTGTISVKSSFRVKKKQHASMHSTGLQFQYKNKKYSFTIPDRLILETIEKVSLDSIQSNNDNSSILQIMCFRVSPRKSIIHS